LICERSACSNSPSTLLGMQKKAANFLNSVVACDECDLVQHPIPLHDGGWALCRSCEGPLYYRAQGGLDRAFAFALGALVLFLVANAYPIIELEIQGNRISSSLYGAIEQLWHQHMRILAALIAATTIVLPTMELVIMLSILFALRRGATPVGMSLLLRVLHEVRPWSMTDVFVLAVLVSLVKLAHIAHVVIGIALWSFGGMMVLLIAAANTFNLRELWEHVNPE